MWQKGLLIIASNPGILGEVLDQFGLMPNIEMETMGGSVFWDNLANVNGWKIQKNKIFGNCRILDPNDVRKGWGGEAAVRDAFNYLVENYSNSFSIEDKSGSDKNSVFDDIPKLIRELSELKDAGIITENEYDEKKRKLLSRI